MSYRPGDLLTTSDLLPDPHGMTHVTTEECAWRAVREGDLFLVIGVGFGLRAYLHSRSLSFVAVNDVTCGWLKRIEDEEKT